MTLTERLEGCRRFGMRPGLEAISAACRACGDPQKKFKAIHVAGTDGKGAVCAMVDTVLRAHGFRTGRYTSPHLLCVNERFFVDGESAPDSLLDVLAAPLAGDPSFDGLTYFELLTLVAYRLYAKEKVDFAVLETGLGGRLDATNVCDPAITAITRIGLDHCDWLGDTVEKIAAEKAGIIKPGVPVVLGANSPEARSVVEARAREVGSGFVYAPDIVSENDIPDGFPLKGNFNRENAVTAIAVLKTLHAARRGDSKSVAVPLDFRPLRDVVWPGRFQRVRNFLVDGAHNPPAARALAQSLGDGKFDLVAGFCADKNVDEVLGILSPRILKACAVRTNNPRSLGAEELAAKMRAAGMDARAATLAEALDTERPTLVCGSLFLAGEALAALGAWPWRTRLDPAETLRV